MSAAGPPNICGVCQKLQKKYKCPKCSILYCSLSCYKDHQTTLCAKRVEDQSIYETLATHKPLVCRKDKPEEEAALDELGDKVDPSKLELLANSDELKELLQNKHLREYLAKLDKSTNPARDMDRAMKEPIFLEFADECLKLVSS